MKLIPIGPNLVVRRHTAPSTTPSGLYIPDTAKDPINKGTVVSVGRGWVKGDVVIPCECKEGDTVYWSKYQGTEVEVGGEKLTMVREDDVVCRE